MSTPNLERLMLSIFLLRLDESVSDNNQMKLDEKKRTMRRYVVFWRILDDAVSDMIRIKDEGDELTSRRI